MATTIVEQCQVAPSSGAPPEQLLKLLRLDMLFFKYPSQVHTLFFYKLHCSESHFMDTIVPNLKNSLSLTLKHFPPLAGKILIDNNSGLPVSRYVAGQDSLLLTIAVSYADFLNLAGYHPRDVAQLHDFAPDLSKSSALAIQLTLFPNQGICLGITGNHAIGDGATLALFLKMWASISKFNGDDSQSGEEYLPFYDRDVVTDGYRRAMEFWRVISTLPSPSISTVSLTEHILQATFVLSEAEIRKLKNLAIAANSKKGATTVRVSSFVVACAHLWTCLAKSAGEEVDDDETGYISLPVNCRGRLNPPLPDNYFGNCCAFVMAESTYGKLRGKEGFLAAAEAITGTIQEAVGNGRGAIDAYLKLIVDSIVRLLPDSVVKRLLTVGGSSGFDFYGTEFGWGRPIKYETLSGDNYFQGAILSDSREYRGGIEICISMPKVKMVAFAASFNQALAQTTENLWCKM